MLKFGRPVRARSPPQVKHCALDIGVNERVELLKRPVPGSDPRREPPLTPESTTVFERDPSHRVRAMKSRARTAHALPSMGGQTSAEVIQGMKSLKRRLARWIRVDQMILFGTEVGHAGIGS